MTARERLLVRTTLAAALAAAVVWGYARLATARDAARDAATRLADCRRLAAQVEARRGGGGRAAPAVGGAEPQAAELVRRIESAARAAEFPADAVERIEPGPVRRVEGPVGDGAAADDGLSEKPTVVRLRAINVRQLFTFLHAVGGAGTGRPGLQARDVRLTAPSPDDTGDQWSVECTLSYFVRAPEAVSAATTPP